MKLLGFSTAFFCIDHLLTSFLNMSLSTEQELIATEQQLIMLLQAKEKRGFDLLYDKYAACLYLLIIRRVGDQEIAAQVLQDSFIHIWQHIHEYDSSKGTLLSWLLITTSHTAGHKMHT